jgi:hypothetical protein
MFGWKELLKLGTVKPLWVFSFRLRDVDLMPLFFASSVKRHILLGKLLQLSI